jgi:hypothetical protein
MELEEIRCFKVEEMKCLKVEEMKCLKVEELKYLTVEEMRCFDNTFGDIRQLFDLVSPSLQGYFNMTQTN